MSKSKPTDPVTAAQADPDDAWARALVPLFVPEVLLPTERTASRYVEIEAAAGRAMSITCAAQHLQRGWREGRLTRRWIKLHPGPRGEFCYKPAEIKRRQERK